MGDLSKDINSTFVNNRVKALLNIIYTSNWIMSYQNEFFKSYGISPQQYNILRILKGANKPLNVQTIKDRMIERSPNATRLMDKLCAKQFIQRCPSEHDRRVVKIVITEEGKAFLASIPEDFNKELLKNLSEEEAEQLSNLLDKMR
ncbi:MarR family winged helix-turn-helix transcriptional regulator [Jejuia pallidilutea]|jgi:DNA-binding MarR family transcriptional regulator|uniref:Transcriptional regulator n=1 Tax=Jejuia pallidilutea TaxID=504487 RepID=A0A090W495_9FLAO|nr:MarR family transcriptional regulator [Jejuia pallidilutea]GAL67336.1 transcriptional regulator [Jejuia pallidilutea]GAL71003.1 transcriptional regulator [Jejuia pallidilutea]GAL90061.1 transcriptional regulator [Jejuia pallidilutea]